MGLKEKVERKKKVKSPIILEKEARQLNISHPTTFSKILFSFLKKRVCFSIPNPNNIQKNVSGMRHE
jgi:hypothetical protein